MPNHLVNILFVAYGGGVLVKRSTLAWPEQGQLTLRLMGNGAQYCVFILYADNRRILLDRFYALPTDGDSVRELTSEDEKKVEV